jgi:hypothetical protein
MHDACGRVNTMSHSKYNGRYKPNSWWKADCLVTRDRQRFWYRIWRSCDRPRNGHKENLSSSVSSGQQLQYQTSVTDIYQLTQIQTRQIFLEHGP